MTDTQTEEQPKIEFDFIPEFNLTRKEKKFEENLKKLDTLKDSIKFIADIANGGLVFGSAQNMEFRSLFDDELNKLTIEKEIKELVVILSNKTKELCQN